MIYRTKRLSSEKPHLTREHGMWVCYGGTTYATSDTMRGAWANWLMRVKLERAGDIGYALISGR